MGREGFGVDETPRNRQRLDRGERREVDSDEGRAAGQSAPMGVQRIAFEAGRHRQNAAACSGRAGDRRKKAERLGVSPVDILDRDEQGLAVRRSLHQFGNDALLSLRPGRRIHRLIDSASRFRLRNLEQIAQIERAVGGEPQLSHGGFDRALYDVGRRLCPQADKPRHNCAARRRVRARSRNRERSLNASPCPKRRQLIAIRPSDASCRSRLRRE